MSSCASLVALELVAPALARLDLRGGVMLRQLSLDCPQLAELDATYCAALCDGALAGALAGRPPLARLVLSACCQFSQPSRSLALLPGLLELDLSYTGVTDLAPVLASCPKLRSLDLSSCHALTPAALRALLAPPPPQPQAALAVAALACVGDGGSAQAAEDGGAQLPPAPVSALALPCLDWLNVSYCAVDSGTVMELLAADQLSHLALNGCDAVTPDLWRRLNAPAASGAAQRTLVCSLRYCLHSPALSCASIVLQTAIACCTSCRVFSMLILLT